MHISSCNKHPGGCAAIIDPLCLYTEKDEIMKKIVQKLTDNGVIVKVAKLKTQHDGYTCAWNACNFVQAANSRHSEAQTVDEGLDVCAHDVVVPEGIVANPSRDVDKAANMVCTLDFLALVRDMCIGAALAGTLPIKYDTKELEKHVDTHNTGKRSKVKGTKSRISSSGTRRSSRSKEGGLTVLKSNSYKKPPVASRIAFKKDIKITALREQGSSIDTPIDLTGVVSKNPERFVDMNIKKALKTLHKHGAHVLIPSTTILNPVDTSDADESYTENFEDRYTAPTTLIQQSRY